jgi:hypothetical protein
VVDLVKGNKVQAPPELPFEDVPDLPVLGAVRVRGLLFSQRMAFRERCAAIGVDGGAKASGYAAIPELLEMAVVDANGSPVYTRNRWELYGAAHETEALTLFNTALRLSGLSGEDAKKN